MKIFAQMERDVQSWRAGLSEKGWGGHERGKEWHTGQFNTGKEDGKVILPVLFIPPFIPFSHLTEHKPSRHLVCDCCFLFPRWLGLYLRGCRPCVWRQKRTKPTLMLAENVLLKDRSTKHKSLQSILRFAFTHGCRALFWIPIYTLTFSTPNCLLILWYTHSLMARRHLRASGLRVQQDMESIKV